MIVFTLDDKSYSYEEDRSKIQDWFLINPPTKSLRSKILYVFDGNLALVYILYAVLISLFVLHHGTKDESKRLICKKMIQFTCRNIHNGSTLTRLKYPSENGSKTKGMTNRISIQRWDHRFQTKDTQKRKSKTSRIPSLVIY